MSPCRVVPLLLIAMLPIVAFTANGATIDLCGDYTRDVSITKDDEVTMSCQVYMQSGSTITIGPGSIIKAAESDPMDMKPPALIIMRGAKIMAMGTNEEPITFTSVAVTDENKITASGLWGGLVICGKAITAQTELGTNEFNDPSAEGLEGVYYGGDDPEDDSGVLQYVRVWYGGGVVSNDSEINGITFYAVGNGTTVDHIEVAFNKDDGVELFGGSVNMKFVSILFCGDDGIDMDEGYNGNIQFLFVMTGKDGHHGAEIDSMAGQVVDGVVVKDVDSQPRTLPKVYNAMFVGSVHGTPQSVSSDDQREALLRIREGAGGEWGNMVLANVAKVGLLQSKCGSEIRTHTKPVVDADDQFLWFSPNNVIESIYYGVGLIDLYELEDSDGYPSCQGLEDMIVADDLGLAALPPLLDEDIGLFDPTPLPGSILLEDVDEVPAGGFFTPVDFKGPFSPDEDLWLNCWSWLSENGVIPGDC
jgi:hypothetical protein